MPTILGANTLSSGYDVANSLRFDGASSAYLNKTFGSSGNRKTFTLSFWIKKCVSKDHGQSDGMMILGGQQDSYPGFVCFFNRTTDTFVFRDAQASNNVKFDVRTDAKFRDFSAWMHIVVAMDTTQGTASNRIKVYINGTQTTDLNGNASSGGATDDPLYPDQDFDSQFNSNEAHYINKYATNYEDMYLAEYCFIDGQQLDPTSFGEFDSDSPNIWKPIDVSGLTFGTNGFYLDFENASSLGADVSGNSNNWTANNIASTDQSTDTCTNNFATINPLYAGLNANESIAEGNLKGLNTGNGENNYVSTIGVSSGKWYFEAKANVAGDNYATIGIVATDSLLQVNGSWLGSTSDSFFYNENGNIGTNGSASTTGLASYTDDDIIGVRVNLDDNELHFYKNGTIITNTALSITADKEYFFGGRVYSNATGWEFNFGSPPYTISSGNSDGNGYGNFEYAVPSGYYALNTKNVATYG